MRRFVLIIGLLFTYTLSVQAQGASGNTADRESAAENDRVAQAVKAYNKKDIDAYVACFSPEVEVYNASGVLMYKGREKLKESLESFWRDNPQARRQVVERINRGNKIVEREKVTGLKGEEEHSVTAIYELENNLIKSFFFVGEF